MAYGHKTQYPISYVEISDIIAATPQTIFAAGAPVAIKHILVFNTTGAGRTCIFRAVADTPEIFRLTLAANVSFVVPGWRLDTGGLEVLDASSAATGLSCTAFYVKNTQGA